MGLISRVGEGRGPKLIDHGFNLLYSGVIERGVDWVVACED